MDHCREGGDGDGDGGEVGGGDGDNGCDDGSFGRAPAPPEERREAPSSFFTSIPLGGKRFPPLVHGVHGTRRARPTVEIGSFLWQYFSGFSLDAEI